MNRNKVALISEESKKIDELEYKNSNLIKELRQRDGLYKELLNENERLEREIGWAEGNLTEKSIELNKYSNLVDNLMKVISILVDRADEDE